MKAICIQCGAEFSEKEHALHKSGIYFVCPCGNMDGNYYNACRWEKDEDEDDDNNEDNDQLSIG